MSGGSESTGQPEQTAAESAERTAPREDSASAQPSERERKAVDAGGDAPAGTGDDDGRNGAIEPGPSGDDPADPEESQAPPPRRGGGHGLSWLLLLLIAAAAALFLVPNPWRDPARRLLADARHWWQPTIEGERAQPPVRAEQEPAAHPSTESAAAPRPAAGPQPPHLVAPPAGEAPAAPPRPEVSAEAPPLPSTPVATSAGPSNQALDALQRQMERLARSQEALIAGQRQLARTSLREQLALLVAAAGDLPQMARLWQGIARLPGLEEAQRARARRLGDEAQALLHQQRQWHDRLQRLADRLHHPEAPHRISLQGISWLAGNPIAAWLDRQFVLYRLPSDDARARERLARRLRRMAQGVARGHWPEESAWRRTRRQLARWLDPDALARLPEGGGEAAARLAALEREQQRWLEEVR
ncbi:MAG: hypothetical protein D6682_05675 [Zetaproteobacteria bacterium]|nr:MAG: hypothetical protein D6682_05675 [Zetaproteobacteria bacterium]